MSEGLTLPWEATAEQFAFINSLIAQYRASLTTAEKERASAYAERNQCVALIAEMARRLGWWAGVAQHIDKPGETWDHDWRTIVFVDLPTGQVSWHFHDSEKPLLSGLPAYPLPWDGHDTPEKYRRVRAALSRSTATDAPEAPKESEIASDSSALEKALGALREAREWVKQAGYSALGARNLLIEIDAILSGGAHVDGPKAAPAVEPYPFVSGHEAAQATADACHHEWTRTDGACVECVAAALERLDLVHAQARVAEDWPKAKKEAEK